MGMVIIALLVMILMIEVVRFEMERTNMDRAEYLENTIMQLCDILTRQNRMNDSGDAVNIDVYKAAMDKKRRAE